MKKVALVTGASRGLGREIAARFAKAGYRVVINYHRNREAALSVARAIEEMESEAIPFCADVKSSSDIQSMVTAIVDTWGPINVLINNAAITRDDVLPRITPEAWEETIDTNVTGAFRTIREIAGHMIRNGEGHIINIASWSGSSGKAGQAAYSASKSALIGLTRSAALELGDRNIQVNAILPGFMSTDMVKHLSERARNEIINMNALKREQHTHEVADFIYCLTLMKNISGQVFNLDSRI